jgi:competence protein ComEC
VRLKPPIQLTLLFGAGLVTGLLHFGAPSWVIGMAVVVALISRHSFRAVLCAAFALGRVSGEIAWIQEERTCNARLPPGPLRVSVRLLEPVADEGGRIEVQPLHAHCTGTLSAAWPKNQATGAGIRAKISARWVPRPGRAGRVGGTLVVTTVDQLEGSPTLSGRLRTFLSGASRTLYGARAPMVDALILGRRGGIDQALQDRFAQSGLVHLLSISGFHVGVITAWMFLLFRFLRLARARALLLAAGTSVLYVMFLGWPAPAARAAALAVLVGMSRARQRRVETNALLSATCLCVLLLDPWAALDLGAWLSVSALWGATTVSRWTDHALGKSLWWRTLASSVGATLATAPITAAALGAVAVIGIALNFIAIPLAGIAVPGVLASLIVFPVLPGFAAALAGGSGLALHLLELLAAGGARVPGGHMVGAAEIGSAVPWVLALLVSLWAIGRRNTLAEAVRRWSWAGVAALWASMLWLGISGAAANKASGLTLHFLDVGQGDGALLQTPAGRWILIDAGPRNERSDAGKRVVVPFLISHGARQLTLAIVSHAHADHIGGVVSVLQRFHADAVIEPGDPVADPLYYEFLGEIAADSIPWHRGRRGEQISLDSVRFTILHPDDWARWGEDLNEDSVVFLVEYGAFQAIFAGDAGFPAEAEMRGHTRAVDVLKVGHHGSRGSTGDEWLDSLRPKVAVISVGQNTYGHPAPETLARLLRHQISIMRTDRDGPVTIHTDGQRMTVTAGGHSTEFDVRENSVGGKP